MLFVCVLFLFACVPAVLSHPQCTDFAPPFQPAAAPTFCQRYVNDSCCTQSTDNALAERFRRVRSASLGTGISVRCAQLLKDIGCLFCHPYAAHAFDVERRGPDAAAETLNASVRQIPGLCALQCANLYRECGGERLAAFFSLGSRSASRTPPSQREFCSLAVVDDPVYCYPNILQLVQAQNSPEGQQAREGQRRDGNNDDCLCVEEVVSGLVNPMAMVEAKDGTGRIFIVEQGGTVRIFVDGQLRRRAYLDLSDIVGTYNGRGDERGLLGMDLHPGFTTNRRLVVYYNIYTSSGLYSRVSEFLQSASDPGRVDHLSERIILGLAQPEANHNGGQVTFGPDGYLYVFLGDGGGAGDPHGEIGNSLDRSNLLGSILRIDIDSRTGNRSYAIPPDNPFLNMPNVRPEIYAYGLRNPWRCSFDMGHPTTGAGRGRLFCGDVGQNKREEIDIIVKGGNYGWRAFEGFLCYDSKLCPDFEVEVVAPIHDYGQPRRQSVIGGYVYRGCQWPRLHGKYIYGDYESGKLFSLTEMAEESWLNEEICLGSTTTCTNKFTGNMERRILSFGQDQDGEVYILVTAKHDQKPRGKIYHLVDPRRRADPSTCRVRNPFAARPRTSQPAAVQMTLTPSKPTNKPQTQQVTIATQRSSPTVVTSQGSPASTTTPDYSLLEPGCRACRRRQWDEKDACEMQYTVKLKGTVVYNQPTLRRQERLVILRMEEAIISAPQNESSSVPASLNDVEYEYIIAWVLAPSVRCLCPFLRPGKTYIVLARQRNHAIVTVDLDTFTAEWNDSVWPGRMRRLQRLERHSCARL